MSNSAAVLSSNPEGERAPSTKTLDFDSNCIERALGIQWNVSSERPATRRGILTTVSSIYDPLGSIYATGQDAVAGHEPIKETDWQRWKSWLQDLPQLEDLAIRRCFKPEGFVEVVSSQLPHFSDASQLGYGAVTYLRQVNNDGKIHCSFVNGKSRLALSNQSQYHDWSCLQRCSQLNLIKWLSKSFPRQVQTSLHFGPTVHAC